MSEFQDQGSAPGQAGAPMASAGGAGALIRRAREDAGVHIAALAVALKVPVRRLEALEADRYDLLPDSVFARALAGSVCRHLKLDPDRVMPLLPQGQMQLLSVEGKINEPFRNDSQGSGVWAQVSRPALIAAAVLGVAALAVYLLPPLSGLFWDAQDSPSRDQPSATATSPAAGSSAPALAPGVVSEGAAVPGTPVAIPDQPAVPTAPVAPAAVVKVLPPAPVPATPKTR